MISRRDLIKSLATIPVLGAFAYGVFKTRRVVQNKQYILLNELNLDSAIPELYSDANKDQKIRIGLLGYGIRGRQLMRAAGFAHPLWIDEHINAARENPRDTRYQDFLDQEDLNIEITGICDIFDVHATEAMEAAANESKSGSAVKQDNFPKRYKTYIELIQAPDIDAVIIATPDHWHAPMAIEAAKHGKHVYCEKPMTWTVEKTYELRKVVKENNIVFQLGHQGRQTESYIKAKEAIKKGVLGKINLVEVCTNRNDPNGAWVYPIHEKASPETIDWKQFIGQAPYHEFSLERFFRWRCWWDYSTGLTGDLLTHEYDAINQIMGIGIPESVVASGGIYFYKDGRTVPDVQNTIMEFPDQDLTLLYSASLSSNRNRGKVIMGHDGNMELGQQLVIYADSASTRFKEYIENGVIDPNNPIYSYFPGQKHFDAITSPTEKYFAGRGLLYSYRDGKRVDTTHLHIREWIQSIRLNKQPSCDIDQGFEEAISAHMATKALREGKRVYWDYAKEQIVS
ncbi:MAG: Gfo/Idh/MocA family oxidoreductase [Bacteroidales bacterium]|nr:Gfo/Idh/MocA family oxidoreductase [Bacteroidales bacterium]